MKIRRRPFVYLASLREIMKPHEHPALIDDLAIRLSQQGSQLRRLERVKEVVQLGGSAQLFLGQMTGRRSVAEIADAVAAEAGVDRATIAADLDELLVGLQRRGLVGAAPGGEPERPSRAALGIVAPSLRSTIHIDITHRCNEKCIHCLVPRDRQEIPLPELRELVTQAAHLGFCGLALSGGEPTLHSGFWELLDLGRDLGFYFTIFTNGLTLDDAAVARLVAHRPEQVRVSIYSMDGAVHDRVTMVPGSFARTMRAILALEAAGVRLYINSPIASVNYDDFRAIGAFCAGHGFEGNLDPVIQPTRDRSNAYRELQLSYEQAKAVTGYQQSADELVVNVQPGVPVCNVGDDPSVDASLNLYPCPGLRMVLGNLRERRLEELLAHEALAELRELSLDNLEVCQRCNVRDGCYRCHGHPYQESGDYRGCATMDRRQARIRRELMVERGTRKA
jgi:radical SAM protein with 4Fe4S-binding SPASM domain